MSVGGRSFDLAELGAPAVYHKSSKAASLGWAYSFSACGDVPLSSAGMLCGSVVRSAVLQETQKVCHSLGLSATRTVSATESGVSLTFSGGDSGRSTTVAIECADLPRRLVMRWENGATPNTYIAHVRARAGCALECARDPMTGAVCGGAHRGACVIAATPGHAAACECKSGHSGPLCLQELSAAQEQSFLSLATEILFPATFLVFALIVTAMIWLVQQQIAIANLAGLVCGTHLVLRASLISALLCGVFVAVAHPPLPATNAFIAFVHQAAPLSARWRGNNYVRDNGLLPYQLCSANQVFPGPQRSTTTFSHNGQTYSAVLIAASAWGESMLSGQPLRTDAIELLVTYSEANLPCKITMTIHCAISDVQPPIACRFGASSSMWRPGSISTGLYVGVVRCPLGINSSLPDATGIEIAFGDRAVSVLEQQLTSTRIGAGGPYEGGSMSANICYEHVEVVDDLVLCTQPHWFDESSSFWRGSPPYFEGSTLLEAFLLHNLNVVNASRLVIHDLGNGMHKRMKPFLQDGRVKYRTNWALTDELPGVGGELIYAFEAHAETTCMWEHRIRARWVQILHAVDNFLLPTCFGCNVSNILARINQSAVSELRVPIVEAFTPRELQHTPQTIVEAFNVLQRFSLLGDDWIGRGLRRDTPIGNPRHFNEAIIHEFVFPRTTIFKILDEERCIELGLQTVHIMALARPQLDTHIGIPDNWSVFPFLVCVTPETLNAKAISISPTFANYPALTSQSCQHCVVRYAELGVRLTTQLHEWGERKRARGK